MKTLLTLALAAASSAAAAQTPAINPMPDGSRDMYVGLGVVSTPRYEGSNERRVRPLPVIQVQWSNGIFIAGTSAGMHLSTNPSLEYGPLLSVRARRSESGDSLGAIGANLGSTNVAPPSVLPSGDADVTKMGNRLKGMETIPARLQAGAFLNYYLTPGLRLTNSVLGGGGRDRNGAVWNVDLQQTAGMAGLRHGLALSAGLTFANRQYNESYFGVSVQEAFRSGKPVYAPGGGLNDVHAGVRWNWTLAPSWLLISNAKVSHLSGDAKRSPLVAGPTKFTVSTALAYRF